MAKKIKISKSLFPLDYDKNNRMKNYNEWLQYIHEQVRKNETSTFLSEKNN